MLISLRIPDELLPEIDRLAESDGRSRNAFLVRTLKGALNGMDKHDTRSAVERGGNGIGLPVLQNPQSEAQRLHPVQPVRRELVGGDGTAPRSENVGEAKPTQGISIPGVSRGFASLDTAKVELPKPASLISGEIPICGKTWWEEGENYECLMDKWHKNIKCGQRGMVRNITD